MRIPYTIDESGTIVPDETVIPEDKRGCVKAITWAPESQEYEVEFDSRVRIAELEALLSQALETQQ